MSGPPQPPRSGMSLYANLLDPNSDSSAAASISRAPVLFKQSDDKDDASKKPLDPALRFQPIIRRPQAKQVKPKPSFPKGPAAGGPPVAAAAAAAPAISPAAPGATAPQTSRSKLADWAPTEEDEYIYGTAAEKRQRGGRRKKKKKFDERPAETDWDEIYDPARPTNIEEYLRSDEKIREVQDWKAVLYFHRSLRRPGSNTPMSSDEEEDTRPSMSNQFAPPPSYGFAPPPPTSPPRATPSTIPQSETADEAYARRLALSGQTAGRPPTPPSVQPPPPPAADSTTISRAPVRYSPPPQAPGADADVDMPDADDEDVDDVSLPPPPPSKAGFAARIMSKYGWTKGTGLGAGGDGITTALRVQVEKRRRRADADGGGYAEPGGRGRIIAPKELRQKKGKKGEEGDGEDEDGIGELSQVVVLRGMLEGLADLRAEVEDGLGQEIGEECGERYGRVERLHIDVDGRRVYIKFTDQVSALRAVNALEGRVFNGNTILPRFYDVDRFEKGDYS